MLSNQSAQRHGLLPLAVDQTLARCRHETSHLLLHGHERMATDVKAQRLFLVRQLLTVAPRGNRFEARCIDACPHRTIPEEAELTLLPILLLALRPLQYPH